jgi:hypothetical protein
MAPTARQRSQKNGCINHPSSRYPVEEIRMTAEARSQGAASYDYYYYYYSYYAIHIGMTASNLRGNVSISLFMSAAVPVRDCEHNLGDYF